ncbi:hypothetical protein ATCC90586_008689 [Pythium insidiosum]|nr:hypothetical protein ATCC90586_008689 [Pythium insidiosum]
MRPGAPGLQQRIDDLADMVAQIRLPTPSGSTMGGTSHDDVGIGRMRATGPTSSNAAMPTALPYAPSSAANVSVQPQPATIRPPKIKMLNCERFEVKERYTGSGVGYGFEDFVRRYEHAVATDIDTFQSTSTDRMKRNIMVKFMSARPVKYYHDNIGRWMAENPAFSYSDLKHKFLVQYGCRLSCPELNERMRMPKKPHQTWLDCAEYLQGEASILSVLVNLKAVHIAPELEKAIEHLSRCLRNLRLCQLDVTVANGNVIRADEVEFIAGAQAVSECGWIRQLIEDIFDVNIPPTLKIDYKSAIQSIKNKVVSSVSKDIAIRYHFIKDEWSNVRVKIEWCASVDQLADIFTKPLT